ncbi:MAG: hypothetical protein CMF41_03670 [Legionellales bacterium]|nr:hypothetical protein [Legionellales bacterium]OUX65187.1 MAG: hypothetical protein CBE41_01955 [Gammaproteobacteria bacterium TMED281]
MVKQVTIDAMEYAKYHLEFSSVLDKAKKIVLDTKIDTTPAVVIDIDETILSNQSYILSDNDLNDLEKFCNWQKLGICQPIQSMVEFYNWLCLKNISIFFITARSTDLEVATLKNLANIGVVSWTDIYFRDASKWPIPKLFKAFSRSEIYKNGFEIILNIGDQPTDFEGGFALNHLKVPNPFYLESELSWKEQEHT